MFGKILTKFAETVTSLPVQMIGSAYHRAYIFLLTDNTIGLVNFVHEDLKHIVGDVASLHARALRGETITDEMWKECGDRAEKAIAEKVSDASKEPMSTIMQASTQKGSLTALKTAVDMLILVITSFASQNPLSAAVTALTAFLPGGQITKDALRGVIYAKLSALSK